MLPLREAQMALCQDASGDRTASQSRERTQPVGMPRPPRTSEEMRLHDSETELTRGSPLSCSSTVE